MLCCAGGTIYVRTHEWGLRYFVADFFYRKDGSTGIGAWILRTTAFGIGLYGIYSFRKKQNQCNIDPKRKQKNLILLTATIVTIGLGLYLGLEKWSAWYFDKHIVPAQQKELNIK